jgi:hypothetical protein
MNRMQDFVLQTAFNEFRSAFIGKVIPDTPAPHRRARPDTWTTVITHESELADVDRRTWLLTDEAQWRAMTGMETPWPAFPGAGVREGDFVSPYTLLSLLKERAFGLPSSTNERSREGEVEWCKRNVAMAAGVLDRARVQRLHSTACASTRGRRPRPLPLH